MPTLRDIQLGYDPGAQLNFGRQQAQGVAEQPPVQKFNSALYQLLQQQQQLGTRPFQEQAIAGQEEQVRRTQAGPGNLAGASPSMQAGARQASVSAVQPTISAAQQGQQTFGEQIKSLGSVLESTRSYLADEEKRQQNVKENMRNQILDAAKIGGSQGLQSILNTPEGKQAFKLSGFDADTLIASVKAKEVEDKRQFDVQQATSSATLKALKESQEKQEQQNKVIGEAADIISLTRNLLDSDLSGVTGGIRIKGFIPGTKSREQRAIAEQIKDKLSLANREKLKGTGTISDFEGQMLARAATALNFNLSEDAFKRELRKIQGVFQTAAGGQASIRIVDKSGRVKEGFLNRAQINDAILQGLQVEYTG